MEFDKKMFDVYDNMPYIRYDNMEEAGLRTVAYSDLAKYSGDGVLKACFLKDGKLHELYTEQGNHVGVIAATRLGKTTGYVIPTILSFAKQKVKKSMIISDPKGEVYRLTAATLKKEGYRVRLLNFRDRRHSEYWNPLTPIFRKYMSARKVEEKVSVVMVNGEPRNQFYNKIYEDQRELDRDIEFERRAILEDVEYEIDNLCAIMVTTAKNDDPIWEDGARTLLKAFLYGMLEDVDNKTNPITEDTFSLKTVIDIYSTFEMGTEHCNDKGYFKDRPDNSRAKMMASPIILLTRRATVASYLTVFYAKLAPYLDTTTKMITSCNSFELDELTEGGPVALFIGFRDELKTQYAAITLFVQNAYKHLIETANAKPKGKLDIPFYFILDEFGNFPAMRDFETTISACAGRNIWFILIVQSYAQLEAVYKKEVADIIKDNLNMHIFFGSNNPQTLEAFSKECGQQTIIAPECAISGNGPYLGNLHSVTIPLVPVSKLVCFNVGECIITEANCGYVMFSRLERYYECEEFKNLPLSAESDYTGAANPLEDRYQYRFIPRAGYRFYD